jgi:signal transduction histidine kinase
LQIESFDGSRKLILGWALPIRDADGRIAGGVVVHQDVTELKWAEREIARLAKLPAENPNPVLRVNRDRLADYANRPGLALLEGLGIGPGQPLQGELARAVGEALDTWHNADLRVVVGGYTYELILAPIREGDHVNVYGRDISGLVEAAKALHLQAKELQRSNAELEQFAYVASHDLQEPLRMVSSFMQLFDQEYGSGLDETGKQYVHFAVDGAKRMQQMVSDLLTYSRAGSRNREPSPVDCGEVLAQAVANLRLSIEESGARMRVAPLPVVAGDRSQLLQLFQNLLGNAIKFAGTEAPVVEVGASLQGSDWVFHVNDNGIGIDPKHAERIFDIFQRLHPRSKYSGSGIGLAVCKKIVELHGGRIWVESRLGQGAKFFFTIPAER